MDHDVLLRNIEALLKAKKVSADAVSRQAKRPDAIRNLRRRVRGETDGSWTLDTLTDIAEVFGVPAWELMRPAGPGSQEQEVRAMVRDIVEKELAARDRALKPKRRAG